MRELYAGVDVGGQHIKIGLLTREGEIVDETSIDTDLETPVLKSMGVLAETLKQFASRQKGCCLKGVGVGMAGQVNVSKGMYYSGPNFPGWVNVPVVQELKKHLDLPVILENDANVAALGEHEYGAGKGIDNMIAVTLGTGVGCGIILEGHLYRGSNDSAGEFGHNTIDYEGRMCVCGRKGCVEAYVGARGILRTLKEILADGQDSVFKTMDLSKIKPRQINEAANQGDKVALEVFRKTGYFLGLAIADIANLLNVQRVVVGGGVANAGEKLLGPTLETARKECLSVPSQVLNIVPAKLGNTAGLAGAAYLAMELVHPKEKGMMPR
ncbi:ROK family protein [bacterium]|nr:ROK family protein [bacterium]